MANDWNNVKPVGCKPWLVLPAVYSDALSYGDQIAHFCAALNKLIQNNNTLPEYIQQMIQNYINGDVIGEVVQNIVSQFILNVKYPPENLKPAVGDGSADDTEAIQGCINYAKNHNGMAVYIPSGAYSVQSLTLPGDVSLFGFDRYTTKLVLRGGATTPMISSAGTGFSIIGLTLDGNAGVQVENINVLSLNSQDVLLRDLIVQNGYKLLVYNGIDGHLQINDVVFGSAVYDCVEISGGSIVQLDNCQFTALSQVSGQHVIDISSDGGVYDFVNSAICPVCCVVSGNDNYIQFSSTGAQKNFSDTGLRNNIIVSGQENKGYLSGDLNSTIEGSLDLNINGAYSENVSGVFTRVINNSESKKVTGTSTETYGGLKTEKYNGLTENITGRKVINTDDIWINTKNPLQYKTPVKGTLYDTIPFKDDTSNYNVLVETESLKGLSNSKPLNVLTIGVKNDGSEDCTSLVNQYTATNALFFPAGVYLFNGKITLINDIYGVGYNRQFGTDSGITVFKFEGFNDNCIEFNGNSQTNFNIKNICVLCSNTIRNGINIDLTNANQIFLDSVSICDCPNTSFFFTADTGSRVLYMNNCNALVWNNTSINTVGIQLDGALSDSRLTNIELMAICKGIDVGNCFAIIDNVHIYTAWEGINENQWTNTRGIIAWDQSFIANNLYIDSCYMCVVFQNKFAQPVITNFWNWNDSRITNLNVTNKGTYFYTNDNGSIIVTGGRIYPANCMNVLSFGDRARILLKAISDETLTESNWNVLGASKQSYVNNYVTTVNANSYTEIFKARISGNDTTLISYSDDSGSCAQIELNNNDVYKVNIRQTPGLYYKKDNDIITIYAFNALSNAVVANISVTHVGIGLYYLNYNDVSKSDGSNIDKASQSDTSGLTEITEKS